MVSKCSTVTLLEFIFDANLYKEGTEYRWQIPSTYGQERLNLLRQLEKVKEMKTSEVNSDENTEEEAE